MKYHIMRLKKLLFVIFEHPPNPLQRGKQNDSAKVGLYKSPLERDTGMFICLFNRAICNEVNSKRCVRVQNLFKI